MPDPDRVPRLARAFVATLIIAMTVAAVFELEPWPLTSFRLFSTARIDQQTRWSATTVDAEGVERAYPLGGEERGFRGFPFVMSEFVTADEARRDELCRTWVEAAPELVAVDAVEVRLYLRTWNVSQRTGDEALPGRTELAYECGEEGVSVAG